jgi:hypothetical protein
MLSVIVAPSGPDPGDVLTLADFTGSGRGDIAWHDASNGGRISVFKSTGTGF